MDERRIADYFVVAGLPDNPEPVSEISRDSACHFKLSHNQAPITDVAVIFPTLGEGPPDGYIKIDTTPTGFPANLNHGSLRSPEVYLCYRRGRDKPPLVDVGIMYECKDRLMSDSEVVLSTPGDRPANVNNSGSRTYVTYRRAPATMPCNELVVTDMCVILASKGELPPHAYCMINKNLNRGMVGSDVFLCYKKSMNLANLISYKPAVLCRYPRVDRPSFPFPSTVPLFCLPMGASIECWPAQATQPLPVFSTFVLTVSDAAEKVYGAAVTFYERISRDQLTETQFDQLRLTLGDEQTVNINKCICLLSHWPFFETFEKFLCFIYEMSQNGPHFVPIERQISHFLDDVPFPSPQRPHILVQLDPQEYVVLTQPEDFPIPRSGAGFRDLLLNLGPDNCLMVLLLALTEQKLLVHSLRPNVLTAVAEAISMIMFPFKWQCPYIPLCPLGLAEVLHAPLPFLIGVDSRFFDLYDPPQDVCCVDLDTNTISVCEDKRHLNIKLLPKKSARALRSGLDAISQQVRLLSTIPSNSHKEMNIDRDFVHRRKELAMELEIQELFLRFMSSMLKGYRNFLLPITRAPRVGTTDPSSLFDLQGFLRSRDKSHHKFFHLLMKTQMFIRFIEERSFVSDMDAGLAFFDECTEKVESEEDGKLLELDDSHRSERTVFITPLEASDPSAPTEYHYHSFNLDPVLFGPRKEQLSPGTLRGSTHPTSWLAAAAAGAMFSPGSPMARRAKHEIRSAQRLAKKHATNPELWAKCLLATCYSLWFLHLPGWAMLDGSSKAITCLRTAYDLLVRIHKMKLQPSDEVCYRVMMQLCGVYGQPVLAVKLLFHMKRCGVQPNALTYGLYNRAVLEAKWPSDCTNSSQLLWNKLRNVILGVALFRQAGSRRRLSEDQGIPGPTLTTDATDGQSHTSVDSANSHEQDKLSSLAFGPDSAHEDDYTNIDNEPNFQNLQDNDDKNVANEDLINDDESRSVAFDRFRSRIGSIVRPGGTPLLPITNLLQQKSFESSAGLLMTGSFDIGKETSNKITNPCIQRKQENPSKQNEPSRALSPVNVKRRPRSGSCSELGFRSHIHLDGADSISSRPISPLVTMQDVTNPNSPRTPRTPRSPDQDGLRQLIRSESFANDTKILDKLSRLKHETNSLDEKANTNHAKRSIFPKFHDETDDYEEEVREDWTLLEDNDQSKSPLNLDNPHDHINMNQKNDTENLKENNISHSQPQSNQLNSSKNMSSPLRTPVTQNDPLGALDANFLKESSDNVKKPQDDSATSRNVWPHRGRHPNHALSDTPLLFTRSSTFASHSQEDEEDELCLSKNRSKTKPMQRSSTMPADVAASGGPSTQNPGVASSFSSLSSSLKSSFSRYSPARFSLRKEDLRIGTQLIENALNNLSPSNITTKKSNEILLGGLNSLKSAATSMVKKFDEIKEAISATGTPVKSGSSGNGWTYASYMAATNLGTPGVGYLAYTGYGGLPNHYSYQSNEAQGDEDSAEQDSVNVPQSQLDHWWEKFAGDSSRKGSSCNLYQNSLNNSQHHLFPENLYPKDRPPTQAIALELLLTSCSKCHQCCSVLYDEEIMAGWVPEDSNLNTKCTFCQKATVPFLSVNILDYRSSPPRPPNRGIPANRSHIQLSHLDATNSLSSIPESTDTDTSMNPPIQVNLEPITVPYLNPLVLRKELENILYSEGDVCLTRAKFVDEHPIIYWNMVYVFQRINVISHLPGLTLESNIVNKENRPIDPSWLAIGADHRHVRVKCMWDNPRLHEEIGQPMYLLWQQNDQQSSLVNALVTDRITISRNVMQMVISSIQCNDLNEPLRRLATERHKFQGVVRNHSIYREILFLAMTALGRDHIDIIEFDKEYTRAYDVLEKEIKNYLHSCDQPLNTAALCCRCYFRDLEL